MLAGESPAGSDAESTAGGALAATALGASGSALLDCANAMDGASNAAEINKTSGLPADLKHNLRNEIETALTSTPRLAQLPACDLPAGESLRIEFRWMRSCGLEDGLDEADGRNWRASELVCRWEVLATSGGSRRRLKPEHFARERLRQGKAQMEKALRLSRDHSAAFGLSVTDRDTRDNNYAETRSGRPAS
jgi:hypothetical protein